MFLCVCIPLCILFGWILPFLNLFLCVITNLLSFSSAESIIWRCPQEHFEYDPVTNCSITSWKLNKESATNEADGFDTFFFKSPSSIANIKACLLVWLRPHVHHFIKLISSTSLSLFIQTPNTPPKCDVFLCQKQMLYWKRYCITYILLGVVHHVENVKLVNLTDATLTNQHWKTKSYRCVSWPWWWPLCYGHVRVSVCCCCVLVALVVLMMMYYECCSFDTGYAQLQTNVVTPWSAVRARTPNSPVALRMQKLSAPLVGAQSCERFPLSEPVVGRNMLCLLTGLLST